VFSILVVAILILIVFLYLYQNRKQFAIARALGSTGKSLHLKQLTGMLCLSFPAAIIGSLIGWLFATNEIANTLKPLQDLLEDSELGLAGAAEGGTIPTGFELDIILNINYLFLFTLIILVFILVAVIIFGRLVNRGSVLALLQGETKKRRGRR
jgi:ABC-type antimicrobial peptide transport system permease subunit